MINDLILDRRDGIFYNPFDFYIGVVSKRRGSTCSGTTCQAWTGCVYRK